MPKSTDLEKTWIPGPSRGSTTFNAPGNLTVPYGRYKATISGRGGSGNAPNASAWNTNYNTNYNVAYPIAAQPIATQPIATWNTNYNTVYPIANQPFAGSIVFYNQYSFTIVITNPNWNWNPSPQPPGTKLTEAYYTQCIPNSQFAQPWSFNQNVGWFYTQHSIGYCSEIATYNTNYNVAYPIANRPAATWNTNYNTNYNTVYPIANRPIATQPIAAYTPGSTGGQGNAFGVNLPGGPLDLSGFSGSPGIATPITPTVASYYSYPDNATHAVSVPPGGTVTVTIE